MTKSRITGWLFIIFTINFLLHFHFISQDIQGLHSWRQSQTMWNVRNFVRHDANILNPRINVLNGDNDNLYRYEFPVMQWSIAMVQKVTGEQISVVRIFMFLLGITAVLGMYFLLKQITGYEWSALLGAFLFQLSPVFYYYSWTPLPDVLALVAGIWYLFFILKYAENNQLVYLILSSLFLLVSTLAKLPYLMFAVVSLYFFTNKISEKKYGDAVKITLFHLLFLVPAICWYAWVMPGWTGNPILTGIFKNEVSGFEFIKLIGFHTVKMFPNKLLSLPVWLPFLTGVYVVWKKSVSLKWLYGFIGITMLYLFLQLTTIGRDHDYYLLPFLPWLFIVVTLGLEYVRTNFKKSNLLFFIIGLSAIIYTKVLTRSWSTLDKTAINHDVFIYASELKNAVPQGEKCIILNDPSNYIFAYQVDKMGYVFQDDYLPLEWIEDLIRNQQVQYMYSDSRKMDERADFRKYVEEVVLSKGSIHVFKLKDF